MKIGIDGSCLANRRGFGRFTRELLNALARAPREHRFTVFVDRPSAGQVQVPDGFRTVVVDMSRAPAEAASADGRRRLVDMLEMGRAVAAEKLDMIYFPATYTFFPVWNVRRVVVTMHDILAPKLPGLVFPSTFGRLAWKAKERLALVTADHVVTVSETSRRDLLGWFRLRPESVTAITEGPDAIFEPRPAAESAAVLRSRGLDPTERYFLYVGGLSPHKNLARLIEAFARVGDSRAKLVIVGDFGDVFHTNVGELRAAVERHGLADRVRFTGYVPDEDLVHLYNRAYALILPSLMEGFGLPAVEAMACGVPVLSSTAGSLPEVVGEGGIFFDPTDVRAIGDAMESLLADPREQFRLGRAALERSRRFTWTAAAEGLLDCLERVLRERKPRRLSA